LKAIMIAKPHKIEVVDVERPIINDTEILVKVRAVGICASEVHAFEGTHPWRVPPVISGHEFSGSIVEVGKEVKGFSAGDSVTACPIATCDICEYCLAGRDNICDNIRILGTPKWPGPFAEYVRIPYSIAYRLPSSLTFEEGALIEPLTVGLHTVNRSSIKNGQFVAVLGAGAIGLCTLIIAKHLEIASIISDIVDFKLDKAKSLGADFIINPKSEELYKIVRDATKGKGVDVAIDCAGVSKSLTDSLSLVKKGGTVVVTALFKKSVEMDPGTITTRELDVRGAILYTKAEFKKAVSVSERVRTDLRQLITHRMHFEDAEEAFGLMQRGEAIRIMLSP
jgi:L-iditol 2-dehydrogenase